jgi:hypothetical protein
MEHLQNLNSLKDFSNYNDILTDSTETVLNKYFLVMNEYITFMIETIKISNTYYFQYILIKGFETMSHVFIQLLLYTKNVNIVFYNTQKSFYFFSEFIEQINNSENAYLKLNCKDAILYDYEKTIFEIPLQKQLDIFFGKEEKELFDCLHIFQLIYKKRLSNCIREQLNYNTDLLNLQPLTHLNLIQLSTIYDKENEKE